MIITRVWTSEDEVTNWAINWLLEHRFAVVRNDDREEWLKPADFCRRYAPHLTPSAFCNRLARGNPPHFLARRNEAGRLLALQPNPVLIDFCNRPLQPGRRSDLHGS